MIGRRAAGGGWPWLVVGTTKGHGAERPAGRRRRARSGVTFMARPGCGIRWRTAATPDLYFSGVNSTGLSYRRLSPGRREDQHLPQAEEQVAASWACRRPDRGRSAIDRARPGPGSAGRRRPTPAAGGRRRRRPGRRAACGRRPRRAAARPAICFRQASSLPAACSALAFPSVRRPATAGSGLPPTQRMGPARRRQRTVTRASASGAGRTQVPHGSEPGGSVGIARLLPPGRADVAVLLRLQIVVAGEAAVLAELRPRVRRLAGQPSPGPPSVRPPPSPSPPGRAAQALGLPVRSASRRFARAAPASAAASAGGGRRCTRNSAAGGRRRSGRG